MALEPCIHTHTCRLVCVFGFVLFLLNFCSNLQKAWKLPHHQTYKIYKDSNVCRRCYSSGFLLLRTPALSFWSCKQEIFFTKSNKSAVLKFSRTMDVTWTCVLQSDGGKTCFWRWGELTRGNLGWYEEYLDQSERPICWSEGHVEDTWGANDLPEPGSSSDFILTANSTYTAYANHQCSGSGVTATFWDSLRVGWLTI